jgi:hypothetical protein
VAFNDFTYRVQVVDIDSAWQWCDKNVGRGHWGMMASVFGATSTYCFEYEEDLLAFRLVHGKICVQLT